jgi:Flp pilus assembly protein TadG
MSAHHRPHQRRRGRERGATLIEFALVLPFLLLMAFGTAEMGLAWVANNRVEGSVSTAARIGASSGALAEADRSILQSLRSSLPQDQLDNLDRVVVFKSATADGQVPAGCVKAVGSTNQVGVNGSCNTYSGNTVRAVTSTTNLGAADDFWPSAGPPERNDNLSDPPDYIGVWVRTQYDAVTGTFFDDMTITKVSVYRIQPDIDG